MMPGQPDEPNHEAPNNRTAEDFRFKQWLRDALWVAPSGLGILSILLIGWLSDKGLLKEWVLALGLLANTVFVLGASWLDEILRSQIRSCEPGRFYRLSLFLLAQLILVPISLIVFFKFIYLDLFH